MLRTIALLPFVLLSAVGGTLDVYSVIRRRLAIGDFDAVNSVLEGLTFPLPNQTITQDVAGSTLSIDLVNLVCSGLSIGDVQISYRESETLNITLNLIQADISCQTLYNYNYLFFSGGGTGYITTQDNNVTLNLTLTSDADSLMTEPPVVSIESCDSTVNIADIQLDGNGAGIIAEIINALEFAIKGLVADQIKTFLCAEVSSLETVLQTGLDNLYDVLSLDLPDTDPLDAENALDPNVDWLDLKDPSSWLENAVSLLLDQAQDFLVNNIDALWEGLLGDDGSLVVDTAALGIEGQTIPSFLGDFTFSLNSARIYGLDSVNVTNLTVIGASTLSAAASVASLRGELETSFQLQAGDQSYGESAVVSIELNDISIQLAVLAAIDESQLGDVVLGSILRGEWGCLFKAIREFAVSQLQVEVTAQKPTVSGIKSPGLDRLVQDAASQMFDTYGDVLNTALPMWIEAGVLELNLTLPESNATNCTVATGSDEDFIDFRDLFLSANASLEYGGSGSAPYGSLVAPIKDYLASMLTNASTIANLLGTFISPSNTQSGGETDARSLSGELSLERPIIDYSGGVVVGGLDADIVLIIDQLSIENLDTLSDPKVLEPVRGEGQVLNNSVVLAESKPLRLSAHVLFSLKISDDPSDMVSNDMIVSVEMNSVQLILPILAKIMTSRVMNFPIQDILTWQCWLSTFPAPALNRQGVREAGSAPTLSILDIGFSAATMNFTVDCLNCTSPKFNELSALLNKPNSDELATDSAENVIEYLLSLLTGENSIAQTSIDRMLADAPKYCPHRPEFDPNATKTVYESVPPPEETDSSASFLYAVLISILVLIAAAAVIGISLKFVVARRNRKWLATLPQDQLIAINENQKAQRERGLALNMGSDSLIRSKDLPLFVRLFIPIVIFGNIALFLSGHLSLGGEVRIYLQIGGQDLVVSDFYTFSIAQSGIELWNAGAKAIALLMLLFSGVWPYLKQVMTLVLWVVPPRYVSVSMRESTLLWLDTLAKWSMIDVFVMIVTLAAFHVTIKSPEKPFLPTDLYQVDLLVAPLWGLYANMIAQLVSQVSSHFIIHYHRLVANAATRRVEAKQRLAEGNVEQEQPTDIDELFTGASDDVSAEVRPSSDTRGSEKLSLCNHEFTRPHRGETSKLQARSWVSLAFVFLCVTTVTLLLVGCILPSYSFDYLGLVGVAVESGNDFQEATVYLGVISTAQLLMDQARFLGTTKDMIGLLSISIVLVLTSMIVPIAQVLTLLVEWLLPVRRVAANRLRVAIEVLQAWQYVEVFLLSVIVAVWQIGDVSTFLVNDYCGGLSATFSALVSSGILDPADAQCFRSQASIEPASYVLIAAAIVLIILTNFVSKATIQRSREDNERGLQLQANTTLSLESSDKNDDDPPAIETLASIPVLFTDQYRWLLVSAEG